MARKSVADEKEILKNFTEILRDESDSVKVSDKMKAAEFLAKHYSMFDDKSKEEQIEKIMIIDNIPKDDSG